MILIVFPCRQIASIFFQWKLQYEYKVCFSIIITKIGFNVNKIDDQRLILMHVVIFYSICRRWFWVLGCRWKMPIHVWVILCVLQNWVVCRSNQPEVLCSWWAKFNHIKMCLIFIFVEIILEYDEGVSLLKFLNTPRNQQAHDVVYMIFKIKLIF